MKRIVLFLLKIAGTILFAGESFKPKRDGR